MSLAATILVWVYREPENDVDVKRWHELLRVDRRESFSFLS